MWQEGKHPAPYVPSPYPHCWHCTYYAFHVLKKGEPNKQSKKFLKSKETRGNTITQHQSHPIPKLHIFKCDGNGINFLSFLHFFERMNDWRAHWEWLLNLLRGQCKGLIEWRENVGNLKFHWFHLCNSPEMHPWRCEGTTTSCHSDQDTAENIALDKVAGVKVARGQKIRERSELVWHKGSVPCQSSQLWQQSRVPSVPTF